MKIWREKDKVLSSRIWKATFWYKKKRYRPHAFTKADLEEIINQIRSNADRRKAGLESRAPKISLQQLFDAHIKTFNLKLKTHRRGKVVLQGFIKHVGPDKAVEDIEATELNSFVRHRKSQSKLMPESVNKEVGYVSAMLREAPKYFKSLNKYVRPKMPWATVAKNTSQRPIYKDEREALIAYLRYPDLHPKEKASSRAARQEYADMFELAYHTVLRWGELHLIEWRMIDWRKALLVLPEDIAKTDERVVPLNSKAIEILNRRKAVSVSKYVFPGNTLDVPRKYYYEGIRRAAKKLKLPFGRDVGFTLHSTKHTALTDILEETGDIKAAQDLGAHTRATMTQKYLHTDLKRMREAVEKLAKK